MGKKYFWNGFTCFFSLINFISFQEFVQGIKLKKSKKNKWIWSYWYWLSHAACFHKPVISYLFFLFYCESDPNTDFSMRFFFFFFGTRVILVQHLFPSHLTASLLVQCDRSSSRVLCTWMEFWVFSWILNPFKWTKRWALICSRLWSLTRNASGKHLSSRQYLSIISPKAIVW